MSILEIKGLTKSFGGKKVLDEISFSVEEHSVYGFLGPNGAGKTTTMKLILGMLKPDSGEITVCSEKVSYGNSKTNQVIGYLPDVPEFYGYMTPVEYLKFCGEICGMEKKELNDRIKELLVMTGMEEYQKKRIGGFSRGMKQRLGIAQALLNQPRLLICDEPTSALDPVGRKEILDVLAKVKEKTTVIFSTHILADAERICDHVTILNKGRIALQGGLKELKEKSRSNQILVKMQTAEDAGKILQWCEKKQGIRAAETEEKEAERSVMILAEDSEAVLSELMRFLVESRLNPIQIERMESTLEDLFLEVVR